MTINRGKHTFTEIHSQPVAWQAALDVVQENRKVLEDIKLTQFDQVVFTGCGSTYYLSLSAATTLQQASGSLCKAIPASELLFSPDSVLGNGRTLLIAISRSGSTSETIQAVQHFRKQQRGTVIGITNYGQEALAELADIALVISAGQESSVAQTRSFASMLVAATAMTSVFSHRLDWLEQMQALPQIGTRLMERYEQVIRPIGENLTLDRFYFLGSGARYGIACETNLKLKEMTLTHSEPFHFFEFRHGPMAMVTPTTQMIGLHSNSNQKNEQQVLKEMAALGAHTLSLADSGADFVFESKLPESLQNVLFLPILQLMAYYRSIQKGLDPDHPNNLSSVIKLVFEEGE